MYPRATLKTKRAVTVYSSAQTAKDYSESKAINSCDSRVIPHHITDKQLSYLLGLGIEYDKAIKLNTKQADRMIKRLIK